MAQVEYDIKKLTKIIGFEPHGALSKSISRQEYDEKLTEFIKNSQFYLGGYTPSVVIYDADDRKKFLAEVEKIQLKLFSLGAIFAAAELKNLSDAVNNNEVGVLSDRLTTFHAEMNILSKAIAQARIN